MEATGEAPEPAGDPRDALALRPGPAATPARGRRPSVVHLSIVHKPLDTRIFERECRTLAAAGYDVHLVAPDPPAASLAGVRFHASAATSERPALRRQPPRWLRAACHARALQASFYHLHEPHLIPLGLYLKARGATVVYDVHEDYPDHARTKLAARPVRRRLKPLVWRALEGLARRRLDAFVCATPAIARDFPPERTVVVRNFPALAELAFLADEPPPPYGERPNAAVFLGGIKEILGYWEMARAVSLLPGSLGCRLRLVGDFLPPALLDAARRDPSFEHVDYTPWLPHGEALRAAARARVGLAVFHPLPNHLEAMPRKLYEYLALGLPVLVSDFPAWRRLVEETGCGIAIPPRDPDALAEALEGLLLDPERAEEMGRRGRSAVEERLNWEGESRALLELYARLAPAERRPAS